jgi:hypothetical protein
MYCCRTVLVTMMTTFDLYVTDWTRYNVLRRYKVLWRRPNGTRLPKLWRTSPSCTCTQYAFLSLGDCLSKEATITAEVGLSVGLIDRSRGRGGYECDEHCHVTLHYLALYMYSLLNWFVLVHRQLCRLCLQFSSRPLYIIVLPIPLVTYNMHI